MQYSFIETAVFFQEDKTLIISDLQFGQEEELRSKGHLVLDKEFTRVKKKLKELFIQTKAKRLVINGDIKHEFARINKQEWDSLTRLFAFIEDCGIELILVKGNHDNMLVPVAKKAGLILHEEYQFGDVLCVHGHEKPKQSNYTTLIIGHEHPAVRFDDGVRKEMTKCFLVGKWHKKELIVLPSFSEVTIGTDVLTTTGLGPFISEAKEISVHALVENSVINFGLLSDLRKIMTAQRI